jgi:hypothetical protein
LKKTKDGKLPNTQTKLEEMFVKVWLHLNFFGKKSPKCNKSFEPMTRLLGNQGSKSKVFT